MKKDTASLKKCPICGTENENNAESCKYCGYLFENIETPGISTKRQGMTANNSYTSSSIEDNPPIPASMVSTSTGTPLFVVSKSLIASIVPAIIYLFIIGSINLFSSFDLVSIGLIVVFILIIVMPILFTPRKYEFYEESLQLRKIIGSYSEIPYSELTLYEGPTGRRPQIVLTASGRRRPIMISKNPNNATLGMDLRQFLSARVKKHNPPTSAQSNHEESDSSSDSAAGIDATDDSSSFSK